MAELTAYECFVFQDGKIKVLHKEAGFTRDATPEEVWQHICELQDEISNYEAEWYEREY